MKLIKNSIPILLFALIAFTFQSCNQASTKKGADSGVQHYRMLQFSETPYDIEKGTHSITPEQAASINNYKFTYDDMGRLASVEFCRGEEILTYGSFAKITYTYEGNQQVKQFFNKAGEQIESSGVFKAAYTLDDKGMRTALHFFDKDGNPVENRNSIHRYEWSKLDNGMIRELRYNLADVETVMNPFCPFYELRFEYDQSGFVTRMSNFQADTLYDCTAENCGDIGVSYFLFTNNESGDLLGFSVHNTVGQLSNLYSGWAKREMTVDQNGYVTELVIYDQDDELLSGNGIPVIRTIYDEHGAPLESQNYNSDRVLINNPGTGVAITQYVYDDKGNRTETLRFDKDRVAVEAQ